MTLSNGQHYLAIPGPSVMPDRVLRAMHRAAPNIYMGEMVDLTHSLVPDLKAVAQTDGDVAIYIANGHGAWEAAIANTLAQGDTVLMLNTGMFCMGWGNMAAAMGMTVQELDFGKQGTFDFEAVRAALTADTNHKIKAVMAVHVDTSSSVKNDISALRDTMNVAKHPALLFADCIASLGCDEFQMDAWGVDLMVAGCQKGLMTPPGMAFVFMNDRAKARRLELDRVSMYWDWTDRINPEMYYQFFCGTAPTHHLYGLREALDMMKEEGLPNVYARHAGLAQAVQTAVAHWGQDGPMAMNIDDPTLRSNAVTSVRVGAPCGTRLRDWVTDNAGVTLGIGLGMAPPDDPAWHGFFRIGHMGHVNAQMVLGVLGSIEAGLSALNIPHTAGGVGAAAQSIAMTAGAPKSPDQKVQGGCCN